MESKHLTFDNEWKKSQKTACFIYIYEKKVYELINYYKEKILYVERQNIKDKKE